MKTFLALIALAFSASAQSYYVPAPMGGHVRPMQAVFDPTAATNYRETVNVYNFPLTFPKAPQSVSQVTISYTGAPQVGWWLENTMSQPWPGTTELDMGVICNFTYRPWNYHCQGYWIGGYWEDTDGKMHWTTPGDVPFDYLNPQATPLMRRVGNSGQSIWYPAHAFDIAAFDGLSDAQGPSGRAGTQVGGFSLTVTVTDPTELAFFKRGDINGNVTIYFAPRAVAGLSTEHPPGHWYLNSSDWTCDYDMNMSGFQVTFQ